MVEWEETKRLQNAWANVDPDRLTQHTMLLGGTITGTQLSYLYCSARCYENMKEISAEMQCLQLEALHLTERYRSYILINGNKIYTKKCSV